MSENSTFILIAQNGNPFQFQMMNIYVLELNALKMFTLHFGCKRKKNLNSYMKKNRDPSFSVDFFNWHHSSQ